MNHPDLGAPDPDAPAPAAAAARIEPAPTDNERLCHLFRAALKNGRIHLLYLPILKYRHACRQAGAAL